MNFYRFYALLLYTVLEFMLCPCLWLSNKNYLGKVLGYCG